MAAWYGKATKPIVSKRSRFADHAARARPRPAKPPWRVRPSERPPYAGKAGLGATAVAVSARRKVAVLSAIRAAKISRNKSRIATIA
jgi:hypothetical protein